MKSRVIAVLSLITMALGISLLSIHKANSITTPVEQQLNGSLGITSGYPSSIQIISQPLIKIDDYMGSFARLQWFSGSYRIGLAERWGGPISLVSNVTVQFGGSCLTAVNDGRVRGYESGKYGLPIYLKKDGVSIKGPINGYLGYTEYDRGVIRFTVPGSAFGVSYPLYFEMWLSGQEVPIPMVSPSPTGC